MAETSDYTGWVPVGTPLRYAPPPEDLPSPSPGGSFEETDGIFKILTFYFAIGSIASLVMAPVVSTVPPFQGTLPKWDLSPLPDNPIAAPSSGVVGQGMWTGPGVVYYAV